MGSFLTASDLLTANYFSETQELSHNKLLKSYTEKTLNFSSKVDTLKLKVMSYLNKVANGIQKEALKYVYFSLDKQVVHTANFVHESKLK